ncbi:MAG: LacI family DNA-binding transcriptional regulator [Anaerolineaceae bacterium]|nr:LacI family DNA-binding transcriptional regulator [Anaerolineaceae bacterium]
MSRRITMMDISELAGVSVSTVSRALNGSSAIPEATRERIVRIAEANNYVVDGRARNFRLQRSQTLALVFPYLGDSHRMISDPFYMEILGAITDALADYDYDVVVSRVPAADDGWCQKYASQQRVDGVFVVDRSVDDVSLETLNSLGANVVIWGAPMPEDELVSVGCDSIAGGRKAVEHLLGLGRRKIGFIGGAQGMVETHQRFIGYQQALETVGRPLSPDLVAFTDFTPAQGVAAAQRMLASEPDLDGLFVCSDFMSIGIMEYLRAQGRRVPDDISLVGYDDIQLAAFCSPPLTTIRQPIEHGGRLMVAKMLELIDGHEAESVILPAELIVRESCGAQGVAG